MSEFSYHIEWLNPLLERLYQQNVRPLTAAEIDTIRNTCKRVLSDNPSSDIAPVLLQQLASISSQIRFLSPETMENPEHRKMKEVVSEAVALGIVREEIFPSQAPSTLPPAYLLSSSHFPTDHERDPTSEEDAIQTQVELFRLVHLMHKDGMTTPMHVEGRMLGRGYTPFPAVRPVVEIRGRDFDIHSPEAQAFLFAHPEALGKIIDQYIDIAAEYEVSAPIFYAFTSYPHIAGAHSRDTDERMDEFLKTWLPFYRQFMGKYQSFFKSMTKRDDGLVDMQISTGWDGDGMPVMQLGDQWIHANVVQSEFQWYLKYADKLQEMDEVRERELASLFENKSSEQLPVGFAGKGHEFSIADLVTQQRDMHVLTPASSVQHDHLRRRVPMNDPSCGLLWIDVAQKITQAAKGQKRRDV